MRAFYHPGYYFPLPEEHPFPMDKFWRSEAMLRDQPVPELKIVEAAPATWAQLLRVHTPDYLDAITQNRLTPVERVKLGLPAGEALLNRSRLEVGGTIAAAHAALREGVACNLAGGTHHAFADRGQGYCVLNDVVIALRDVRCTASTLRVFIIDTDAHQGNGTHALLAEDADAFTYSIHVGRNYPAVKCPGSLDVELPRFAPGTLYLERLAATLAPALHGFQPQLIFWIAGADVHQHDRFGQLNLNDDEVAARDELVLECVARVESPLVVLYGGGYNQDRIHTARLHAATVERTAAYARRRAARPA